MPFGISVWELLILLVVLLLIFGAKRLPEMGKSLGKGMREFKDSVTGVEESVDDRARPAACTRASVRASPSRLRLATETARRSGKPSARTPPGCAGGCRAASTHGEEATLVEHLDELRSRLIIALLALVPAFLLAFAFHEQIIEWLMEPLPDDKRLVTLGVTEPFTTSVKVSLLAGARARASRAPVAGLGVPRARGRGAPRSASSSSSWRSRRRSSPRGVAFMYYVVLPRALDFLTTFDEELYDTRSARATTSPSSR